MKRLLIVVLFLAGCAKPEYYNFAHPDFGRTQFDQDRDQCARANTTYSSTASTVSTPSGYTESHISPVTNWPMVEQCLAARGWRKVQQ